MLMCNEDKYSDLQRVEKVCMFHKPFIKSSCLLFIYFF